MEEGAHKFMFPTRHRPPPNTQAELLNFVEKTYRSLLQLEKGKYPTESSLQQICRFDVSIMRNDSGDLQYFVNEVERGCLICFFSHIDAYRVQKVFDGFHSAFTEWLDRHPLLSRSGGECYFSIADRESHKKRKVEERVSDRKSHKKRKIEEHV